MTQLLKEKELAQSLNVHRATLANWRKKGMPHTRTPTGSIRYDADKVLEWMNSQK